MPVTEHSSGLDSLHEARTLGAELHSAGCKLIYMDIGSNRGDSIHAFATGARVEHVAKLLDAVGSHWTQATSCVLGFEANPRWEKRLEDVKMELRHNVKFIHVSMLALVGVRNVSSVSLTRSSVAFDEGATVALTKEYTSATAVHVGAANLADWLRNMASSLRMPQIPIVIRMDIEGAEYELLQDLALSGLRRTVQNPIFVGVEWHRHMKDRVLDAGTIATMRRLDNRTRLYNRARWDVYNYKLWAARLDENLEKILAYQLLRAGIMTNEAL
jgi:FkbM family methyltransferase